MSAKQGIAIVGENDHDPTDRRSGSNSPEGRRWRPTSNFLPGGQTGNQEAAANNNVCKAKPI